jgi:conjugal transfer/entry exclusion protein
MDDDLSAAPSMGASEPAPAPAQADTTSAPASEAPKSADKPLSGREAASRALSEVMARTPGEMDKAAAVLKEGRGADEKLDANHKDAVAKATDAEKIANEASERVKRGWETRRANAEQAKADERTAEQVSEAVKAALPEQQPAPTPEAKPAQVETKHPDAPKWMTKQSASEWQKLPEVVREEIVKRSEAFDRGFAEVKAKADRLDELREYEEMSEQYYQQPLKDTLKHYADLDRNLNNPDTQLATLEKLVSGMKYEAIDGNVYKWDLPSLAAYIVEQSQQGVESFQNPQADLQRELADVKKQLAEFKNGFSERETQRQQQERERSTNMLQEQIAEFANKNDRFNELYEQIEVELHNPRFEAGKDPIHRLTKAYEKVAKLNPTPSLSPPAPDLPAQDAAVQSRRGTASITGAPSGSTPAGKRPVASSPREAARMALSKMGMGSGA